ncbi:MAG: NUDIX hydrolase [Actinobacteria bacterium]|nr:NUDIX hydrolase [Actinomycetota bacterium]
MPEAIPPMARPRVAAGVLIRDPGGRVLLVKPTYKDGWDLPGGYVEPGETPTQACVREAAEELGLAITPGGLLVADWAPHPAEGDKILFVFDGGVLTPDDPQPVPDGVEIAEARFWPPEEFHALTPARLTRRLHLAVTAVASGQPAYAEHGMAPGSGLPLVS